MAFPPAEHPREKVPELCTYRLEIAVRPDLGDALATATGAQLAGMRPTGLRTRKVYLLDLDIGPDEAERVLAALTDPVAEVGAVGALPDEFAAPAGAAGEPWLLTIGFRPGVTDSVGTSVKRAAEDCLGRSLQGHVYTATTYVLWGLEAAEAERAARELHNPLIERAALERSPRPAAFTVPRAGAGHDATVAVVALRAADDAALMRISTQGLLALTLTEMRAIQRHFADLGRDPTDAELECLAQTWSEHCKHKIFAAPIEYTDPTGATRTIERGLFRTYIRGATEAVAAARVADGRDGAAPFLVSVFHDNAGVVRFSDEDHLVYKVETHNSPSALDPYGGAMTGIVGVNRDSLGTGLGADLLTNVWGYCFGEPDFNGQLPPGLMHPRRIRDGVHRGVIDGGNQSGIPYSRGFELFDARYAGKPLVYCGTVAVMPVSSAGRPTANKVVRAGDVVVMLGGRIGKDGIHGATFSSVELDESSPVQAVQIGDPITQKMVADFLTEARALGLYSGLTDNGAGGLSSSVGEMAQLTGGADIDLALAPLKYPGLMPWEVLISEAQERMTLAVPKDKLDALLELARRREVEATPLGEFTSTGRLRATWAGKPVLDLELEFLHEGTPRVPLRARWSPPARPDSPAAAVAAVLGEARLTSAPGAIEHDLLDMLARPNMTSNEHLARRYDHEVKGLSVVKPWVGARQDVPSTATVMRARHLRPEGVVLAEGVHPHYGDLDTDAMARACVDEAVRRALCAGARLDRLAALDNFCWPDPVQSDKTPDGEHKLAQLVRCCEGLRAACEAFGVPLISGKDSMKNDAHLGGVKISIPPTLLVSVIGQMPDVRRALDLTPIAAGDLVFVLGPTGRHLGGSELARLRGLVLPGAPTTDLAAAAARYAAFAAARDAGLVRSAHVAGRGGLAVAVAHMTMAGELGLDLDLDDSLLRQVSEDMPLTPGEFLFSESTGRIVLTCRPAAAGELIGQLGPHGLVAFGRVAEPGEDGGGWLRVRRGAQALIEVTAARLRERFRPAAVHGPPAPLPARAQEVRR
ncbi:AIR synthase-related protein [Nannocystis sp. SCPEA4]|uniref:AIR synthase-related protein n=1 Tax=Nannocystis sp. SCPEA4 TaxID=2996787 RepID=UPI00226E034A|nr:AIR synthase-related protein [Nannocystis sp. SCPEA4]